MDASEQKGGVVVTHAGYKSALLYAMGAQYLLAVRGAATRTRIVKPERALARPQEMPSRAHGRLFHLHRKVLRGKLNMVRWNGQMRRATDNTRRRDLATT